MNEGSRNEKYRNRLCQYARHTQSYIDLLQALNKQSYSDLLKALPTQSYPDLLQAFKGGEPLMTLDSK